ncbi:MAG: endonuclease/exonuclease/phosphatase family protein [Phycisphaerales bacterium]|nr:MAG: endonuclease/exonuclease/phosphatase family protein [Phycisphaerales bacterium]
MTQNIRYCLALAAIVTAVTFPGCSHPDSGQQQEPCLRILTYNVHHCQGTDGKFDYDRVAEIINRLKPDIAALQEIDVETNRSSGIDQAATLAELTGLNYVFGRAIDFDSGQYGLAILSRFEIRDVSNTPLKTQPGSEPRIALAARFRPDVGPREIIFVDTHLCHRSEQVRTMQTSQLNEFANPDSDVPVILAGDLNARPSSEPMKVLLESNWLDAVAPQSRIDYVLLRKNDPWEIVDVKVVDEPMASDHDPVLVTLRWAGR